MCKCARMCVSTSVSVSRKLQWIRHEYNHWDMYFNGWSVQNCWIGGLKSDQILSVSSPTFRNIFFSWFGSSIGPRTPHCWDFEITLNDTRTHTGRDTLSRTPLDEWSARRRDLYLTTQHSSETDIHAPGGIRTHNPSKRAAIDRHLRLHGHRNRGGGGCLNTLLHTAVVERKTSRK
jgi:hypothetical protein